MYEFLGKRFQTDDIVFIPVFDVAADAHEARPADVEETGERVKGGRRIDGPGGAGCRGESEIAVWGDCVCLQTLS